MAPVSDAGYQVVTPSYCGAEQSSKPMAEYEMSQMARDVHILVQDKSGIGDNRPSQHPGHDRNRIHIAPSI
jgi:hypothetical protein